MQRAFKMKSKAFFIISKDLKNPSGYDHLLEIRGAEEFGIGIFSGGLTFLYLLVGPGTFWAISYVINSKILKYWVGVPWGQSYVIKVPFW